MAVTEASDLFIPEVAMDYARQQFVQSLEVYNLIGGSEAYPIVAVNDPVFSVEGQYLQRPVFKRIGSNLVARRDVTSVAGITSQELTGDNEIMVKIHRRSNAAVSKDAARLSRATAEEISAEIGRQVGEEYALNIQTTLINAILGMIAGSTTTHTLTLWNAAARTNLSPDVLNQMLNVMGDQREKFRLGATLITRSECMKDLVGDAIGRGYPGVGDQALKGAMMTNTLGMPFAMADLADLTVADAGFDKYISILLGANAVQIQFTLPMTFYPIFTPVETEQVVDYIRCDMDFAIGCHGAKWDFASGGANPDNTALALSTNWDSTYSNHRELRAVECVHNYSGN
jgi:hypothetical protein